MARFARKSAYGYDSLYAYCDMGFFPLQTIAA